MWRAVPDRCANFVSSPFPRPHVRDITRTDRRTDDNHRLMPQPSLQGGSIVTSFSQAQETIQHSNGSNHRKRRIVSMGNILRGTAGTPKSETVPILRLHYISAYSISVEYTEGDISHRRSIQRRPRPIFRYIFATTAQYFSHFPANKATSKKTHAVQQSGADPGILVGDPNPSPPSPLSPPFPIFSLLSPPVLSPTSPPLLPLPSLTSRPLKSS